MFEELKKQYDEEVAKNFQVEITITLKDGSTKIGTAWEITPMTIAREISKSLSDRISIPRSTTSCGIWTGRLRLTAALSVWIRYARRRTRFLAFQCSSCIPVLAFLAKPLRDTTVAIFACVAGGFFGARDYCQERYQGASAISGLKIFSHNIYEQTTIGSKIPDATSITVYRCGPLIDLCVGSHVPNSGHVKTFKVLKNSVSYFLGDAANDSPQRIYGVSFPDTTKMIDFPKSAKRSPEDWSLRRGYHAEYVQFQALGSDHWHYKDDMFTIGVEKETFALKRMNCPSHCLIFKSRERSYRELPWTMADFGVLHRNEYSGALTCLTLVRGFQQSIGFLKHIYGIFGFTFKLELSTHPENFLGEIETWTDAEKQLSAKILPVCHHSAGLLVVAAIQSRIPYRYVYEATANKDGQKSQYARPMMIHRVIMGSVEYFVGKWPFWLSPRQVLVITVGAKYNDFADEVRKALFDAGMYAETRS
ncbi:hypothetical protein V1505DRAFT_423600 [Lipomyces doorenjongii]